jgi:hypothetical protein
MKTTVKGAAELAKLSAHVASLNPDKTWIVDIKRQSKPRSINQLRLYYEWVMIAGEHLGYFKPDVDDLLRHHCEAPRHTYIDLDGKERWRYSLADAPKREMAAYMDRVSTFLSTEHGLVLPHPEDRQRLW